MSTTHSLSLSLLTAAFVVSGCAGARAPAAQPDTTVVDEGADSGSAASRAAATPATLSELEHAFEHAAEIIAPSVVSITSRRSDDDVPSFLRPFAPPEGRISGMGSGVIIDEHGHILTNNHVVEGSDELVVRLDDGRELTPTIVGVDPKTDLAVIKVDVAGLEPATLGDSDAVRVGQWVIAAGSPFGLRRTVTAGIVSAVGRGSMGITDYGDFIQTDAAVNQGNSGGPLIDLRGQVIGINTAIASATGGSSGIGFSIPITLARSVLQQLIERGHVERGWLGIAMGRLTPELARSFAYPENDGVLINDVVPEGPAAAVGLRPGDIVRAIDGRPVRDLSGFRATVAQTPPGETVSLEVWRDKTMLVVAVQLGRLPAKLGGGAPKPQKTDAKKESAPAARLGLRLQDPAPELREQWGIQVREGAVVVAIAPDSLAAGADLRPGDVIVNVQDEPVRNAHQAERLLRRGDLSKGVRVRVQRGEMGHFVVFRR
jgi:serine protease Do